MINDEFQKGWDGANYHSDKYISVLKDEIRKSKLKKDAVILKIGELHATLRQEYKRLRIFSTGFFSSNFFN